MERDLFTQWFMNINTFRFYFVVPNLEEMHRAYLESLRGVSWKN